MRISQAFNIGHSELTTRFLSASLFGTNASGCHSNAQAAQIIGACLPWLGIPTLLVLVRQSLTGEESGCGEFAVGVPLTALVGSCGILSSSREP